MKRLELRTTQRTQMIPVTQLVEGAVAASGVHDGVCVVYVPHTTAGVAINENADPDVPHDVLAIMDRMIPFQDSAYRHGEGNSAAHIKAVLCGASESIPVEAGRLALGTWQGVFFCEFDGPRSRELWIQVQAASPAD